MKNITQILKKLTLILAVLISISNSYGSAPDAGNVSSGSLRFSTDSYPATTVGYNAPDEAINIELFIDQIQVTLGNSKSNHGSICIINAQGKVVYLDEQVLANSSTVITHEFNNFGAFFIVKVILGNNVISKKYVLDNQ
jgi:hypothetical protein